MADAINIFQTVLSMITKIRLKTSCNAQFLIIIDYIFRGLK